MCHEKLVAGSSNERCVIASSFAAPPATRSRRHDARVKTRVCVGCGRDATYFPSLCVYVRNAAGGSPAGMRRGR